MVFGGLTGVDEASRCSFAELFRLVRQRDLHNPRNVTRGSLDPDGVRGDQLDQETRGSGENTDIENPI